MTGIIGYHSYIPQYRLRRSDVAAALGAEARGERAVAGHDEDTTTLGVAAALPVVHGRETEACSLWFATTDPVYVDKTNATTVHAALDLRPDIAAVDLGASLRSGVAALLAASRDGGLAVLADRRGGAVGGADERTGGDAAAAFLFGDDATVAQITDTAAVTAEFIDRWRAPGSTDAGTWEERFGEQRYAELANRLLATLTEQGVDLTGIARFAVAGVNARAVRTVGSAIRSRTDARQHGTDLGDLIGNAGTAQIGLVLADLLDAAEPGETLLLVSLADGADAIVLRAADTITSARPRPLRDTLDTGVLINYPQYLLWRRRIVGERPRRPDPDRTSAPFAWRNRQYKLSLLGGRCRKCGAVQFPLPKVCYRCRTADGFDPIPAVNGTAHIVTFTVDRLAFSPSPPLVSAIVAFESGGRLQCELTDVRGPLDVGDEVVPTFRRGTTVDGIHNYIWKMRPQTADACNES
ncbi:OB-fold domain-containing protein [Streptomyces sp. NPDC056653]|uniref:OB-fold domain-containing protein n=1 Tax=Streptomyces sp. NPDC056653 TaxID=3345894 RepID=UPI0036C9AEB9